MRPLTLGTAGHIDHGKTVLVEALTGTNTDRLPEERERGISIELGFASLELPSGRQLSVVDVPGHDRFVRTMVAGATGVDLFLLVVAADDGVMPQTREHLAVLELLDVPRGVVAITKIDLAGAEAGELAAEEVHELLAASRFAGTEIVPVCAPTGEGVQKLTSALDRVAAESSDTRPDGDSACLHVDRSFSLKGIGTVVTGTLWSGELRLGDTVRIEPAGRGARVRSIEVHGRRRNRVGSGQRVALNLAGIERVEVERGDVIVSNDAQVKATYLIDASVELLLGTEPLERGARVQVHHGTRASPARISPLDGDSLEPGKRAFAQLRLERQLVPTGGDRIVVRRVAPPDTIGGGTVVDPKPRKHGRGHQHVERLRLLASGDDVERLHARVAEAPSGLDLDECDRTSLERLLDDGRASLVGLRRQRVFAPAQLESTRSRLERYLERGDGKPHSRGALADAAGVSEQAVRALLEELVEQGRLVQRGPGYLAPGSAGLDDGPGQKLLEIIDADFLEPRGVGAAADAIGLRVDECSELLDRLALDGHLVRLQPGLFYHPRAIAEAERRVAAICARDGGVTIATLRDALGSSRKYSQALLEHFDAARLTVRHGDQHLLRRRGAAEGAGAGSVQ